MNRFVICAALAALLGLSACAGQPVIPYDHSAVQNNKRIGLLTVGWPAAPVSFLASDPGRSFGLVGALVDAGIQSGRDKDLIALLTANNIVADRLFAADLTAALEKEGYTVVPVTAENRSDFLKKYPPAADTNVDSYLDIAVGPYGYMAAGIGSGSPYRPWFTANVKLVSASNDSTLMQDIVLYNSIVPNDKAVTISPDPTYAFPAWSDATADKKKSAAGVAEAIDKSASAIADLLK